MQVRLRRIAELGPSLADGVPGSGLAWIGSLLCRYGIAACVKSRLARGSCCSGSMAIRPRGKKEEEKNNENQVLQLMQVNLFSLHFNPQSLNLTLSHYKLPLDHT